MFYGYSLLCIRSTNFILHKFTNEKGKLRSSAPLPGYERSSQDGIAFAYLDTLHWTELKMREQNCYEDFDLGQGKPMTQT